jgi:hypothetical protein
MHPRLRHAARRPYRHGRFRHPLVPTNTMSGLTSALTSTDFAKKRAARGRGSAEVYREASNRVARATRNRLPGNLDDEPETLTKSIRAFRNGRRPGHDDRKTAGARSARLSHAALHGWSTWTCALRRDISRIAGCGLKKATSDPQMSPRGGDAEPTEGSKTGIRLVPAGRHRIFTIGNDGADLPWPGWRELRLEQCPVDNIRFKAERPSQ